MLKKIVHPCKCEIYNGTKEKAFVKIEYSDDGKLSISGVIGPRSNGNCRGSAGQCCEAVRAGIPVKGWTDEMLQKLCDIWERWHLNDMHPECEHQRAAGWPDMARENITLYHYHITNETREKKKAAESAVIAALRKGETFTPTAEQAFFAALPAFLDVYEELGEEKAPYYEARMPLYPGDGGATESKARGWVSIDESEQGLLGKPCSVCGYKYGSKWLKAELPEEVLDFLKSLPYSPTKPAWV